MKITRKQLKKIISEEVRKRLHEVDIDIDPDDFDDDDDSTTVASDKLKRGNALMIMIQMTTLFQPEERAKKNIGWSKEWGDWRDYIEPGLLPPNI